MTDTLELDQLTRRLLAAMEPGVLYARSDLLAELEISAAQWKALVPELVERGLLARTGERRGARYVRPAVGEKLDEAAASARKQLSDRAVSLLDSIPHDRFSARSDIVDDATMSVSAWNRAIAELVDAGLVERTGERRGARYRRVTAANGVEAPAPKQQLLPLEADVKPAERAPATAQPKGATAIEAPARDPGATIRRRSERVPGGRPPSEVAPAQPAAESPVPSARPPEHVERLPRESRRHAHSASRTAPGHVAEATVARSERPEARRRGRFELSLQELQQSLDQVEVVVGVRGQLGTLDELWPACAALASANGGVVLIGAVVRPSKDLVFVRGVREPRELRGEIVTALHSGLFLSGAGLAASDVRVFEVAGRETVLIRVPPPEPGAPPAFVGTDSFSRRPNMGSFRLDELGRFRKCNALEVRARWAEWAFPYTIDETARCYAQRRSMPRLAAEAGPRDASIAKVEDPILLELAKPARLHPRLAHLRVQDVILDLCAVTPLTCAELAELTQRKASNLDERYLTSLVEAGALIESNGTYRSS